MLAVGVLGSRLLWAGFVGYELVSIPDAFAFYRGSAWHAGFVPAILVFYGGAKFLRLSPIRWLDTAFLATAFGQVLGRLGCFLAGDSCHGIYTELPWGMAFPGGVSPVDVTVHPAHLYEALLLFALGLFLIRKRPAGLNSVAYLIGASSIRFLLEFIRFNPVAGLGLTYPQLISLGAAALGGGLLVFLLAPSTRERHTKMV